MPGSSPPASGHDPWLFNLRGDYYSNDDSDDDDDDGSTPQAILSADEQLIKELDISTREDTAEYKANPWSIAKINASSRAPASKTNSSCQKIGVSKAIVHRGPLVDGFKRQAARPPPVQKLSVGKAPGSTVIPGVAICTTRSQGPLSTSRPSPTNVNACVTTRSLDCFPTTNNQTSQGTPVKKKATVRAEVIPGAASRTTRAESSQTKCHSSPTVINSFVNYRHPRSSPGMRKTPNLERRQLAIPQVFAARKSIDVPTNKSSSGFIARLPRGATSNYSATPLEAYQPVLTEKSESITSPNLAMDSQTQWTSQCLAFSQPPSLSGAGHPVSPIHAARKGLSQLNSPFTLPKSADLPLARRNASVSTVQTSLPGGVQPDHPSTVRSNSYQPPTLGGDFSSPVEAYIPGVAQPNGRPIAVSGSHSPPALGKAFFETITTHIPQLTPVSSPSEPLVNYFAADPSSSRTCLGSPLHTIITAENSGFTDPDYRPTKADQMEPLPRWLANVLPPREYEENSLSGNHSTADNNSYPGTREPAASYHIESRFLPSDYDTIDRDEDTLAVASSPESRCTPPQVSVADHSHRFSLENYPKTPISPPRPASVRITAQLLPPQFEEHNVSPKRSGCAYNMFPTAKRNAYDTFPSDEDENWSTLPSRKKPCNKKGSSHSMKQSGRFRLPLVLGRQSKSNAEISPSTTTKTRVITYLPPPITLKSTEEPQGHVPDSGSRLASTSTAKWVDHHDQDARPPIKLKDSSILLTNRDQDGPCVDERDHGEAKLTVFSSSGPVESFIAVHDISKSYVQSRAAFSEVGAKM